MPFTGPRAPPREKTPAFDEADSTDQMLRKRKNSGSPDTSLTEAQIDKHNIPAGQRSTHFGLGRVVDPLGGQPSVPPQTKKTAVSDWLQEQSRKCRLLLLDFVLLAFLRLCLLH